MNIHAKFSFILAKERDNNLGLIIAYTIKQIPTEITKDYKSSGAWNSHKVIIMTCISSLTSHITRETVHNALLYGVSIYFFSRSLQFSTLLYYFVRIEESSSIKYNSIKLCIIYSIVGASWFECILRSGWCLS